MKKPTKKAEEGMQESGKDKFVNDKKLQKNTIPNGTRQDKEPMDTPLEVDQLSYSKKDKETKAPQKILPPITNDSTAVNKKSKINQLEEAWKENKNKKDKSDYQGGNF